MMGVYYLDCHDLLASSTSNSLNFVLPESYLIFVLYVKLIDVAELNLFVCSGMIKLSFVMLVLFEVSWILFCRSFHSTYHAIYLFFITFVMKMGIMLQ